LSDNVIVLRPSPAPNAASKYAEVLNPAQLAAAMHREGPLLVVAGAGSGKTRTLIYRLAHLIESGVPAGAILLLTFTRRAAQEMLRRAELLVGQSARAVAGGTFHSFANLTLRRHGGALGLNSNFTILDRGDMEDVINLLRTRMGLAARERRFPKKSALAEIISMARNKARELREEVEADYPFLIDQLDEITALAQAYDRYKRERGLLDYDDLLYRLAELLEHHPERQQQLSRACRYIMVDEYQDTNPIQARLVRLLAASHDNVMAVGDDAQSIYSFRGANFRNIMDFPKLFPGTRIIKLEENYRSLHGILDLANELIAGASEKYTKALFSRRPGELRPLLVRAEDEHLQSRFVAQRILELREQGISLNEIAVLFRSSFHAFDLELELARLDIPFIKRGGFKFVETAHIKDALAHLRVAVNGADAASWLRVLLLIKGIGPRTAEAMVDRLAGAAQPEAVLMEQAARARANGSALRALAELLGSLRAPATPPAQLALVLEYYLPLMRDAHPDDYPKRERDLEHFCAIAQRYRSLQSLLADMALEPPSDSIGDVLAPEAGVDEYVTLSTIHSAKGLEWQVVFIIWAADGRFPALRSTEDVPSLEEERRLMYVASTRARDELYISYPVQMFDRAQGYVSGQVSRFLQDLKPEILPVARLEEEF